MSRSVKMPSRICKVFDVRIGSKVGVLQNGDEFIYLQKKIGVFPLKR